MFSLRLFSESASSHTVEELHAPSSAASSLPPIMNLFSFHGNRPLAESFFVKLSLIVIDLCTDIIENKEAEIRISKENYRELQGNYTKLQQEFKHVRNVINTMQFEQSKILERLIRLITENKFLAQKLRGEQQTKFTLLQTKDSIISQQAAEIIRLQQEISTLKSRQVSSPPIGPLPLNTATENQPASERVVQPTMEQQHPITGTNALLLLATSAEHSERLAERSNILVHPTPIKPPQPNITHVTQKVGHPLNWLVHFQSSRHSTSSPTTAAPGKKHTLPQNTSDEQREDPLPKNTAEKALTQDKKRTKTTHKA